MGSFCVYVNIFEVMKWGNDVYYNFKKYQEERIYELQVTSTEVEKDTKIFCWIYNGKIKLWVK